MAAQRRPLHLPVAVGLSASVYAISLAGVTALQSAHNAEVAAARNPSVGTLDDVARRNDRLEASLRRSAAAYTRASDAYNGAVAATEQLGAAVAALGDAVKETTGAAARLPSRVSLPSAGGSVTVVVKTTTHATTGASGGG